MFSSSWFPPSYYPPSYFPKNGAGVSVGGGGYGIGGRRHLSRLMEIEMGRQLNQQYAQQRMSYRAFAEALEKMELNAEIQRRQRMLTVAAYSLVLAEI